MWRNSSAFGINHQEKVLLAISGDVGVLVVVSNKEGEFLLGVKISEAQGYKLNLGVAWIWASPVGTPKRMLEVLTKAFMKALAETNW